MAELADAIDLGSIVNRRAGSTPVIRTKKESEGLYDLRFLFRTHSVLEPAGSRSPLRFGRRKADVPGHRAVSASLRSAQSRGPPDLVRPVIRTFFLARRDVKCLELLGLGITAEQEKRRFGISYSYVHHTCRVQREMWLHEGRTYQTG